MEDVCNLLEKIELSSQIWNEALGLFYTLNKFDVCLPIVFHPAIPSKPNLLNSHLLNSYGDTRTSFRLLLKDIDDDTLHHTMIPYFKALSQSSNFAT
jgi:hypothetical protein